MIETQGRCPQHPDRPSTFSCDRCGSFACAEEQQRAQGLLVCEACFARPELSWLELWRRRVEGTRDLWTWYEAAFIPVHVGLAVWLSMGGLYGPAVIELLAAGLSVPFVRGRDWARPMLLLGVPVLRGLTLTVVLGLSGFLMALLPLVVSAGIYRDPRNQLFFRLPLTDKELASAWELHGNNVAARVGASVALLSFLFPPLLVLWPLTFAACVYGLTQVDPKATPPIGRRGSAIAGLVLCVLQAVAFAMYALLPRFAD
jgi:hypothetical protein